MVSKPANLKDVETCVRYILAHYPNTRNNDKLLMLYYWQTIDQIPIPKTFWHDFLTKATHPETIRRTRQKIQAQGNYLPTPETQQKRKNLTQRFKEYAQQKLPF
ncbi:MAG: hypothetical protein QXH20_00450 [Candidatus Bathyarchaeia archaeon]